MEILKTTFLKDPKNVVPFLIANEATDTRYLTGWDLDIEGFQPIGDKVFIGDEFGPYIIVVDRESGVVEEFYETFLGDKKVQSPDNYEFSLPKPGRQGPGDQPEAVARLRGLRRLHGRQDPVSAAGRPDLGCREGFLREGRRHRCAAHPRVRRRWPQVHRPLLALSAGERRQRHRRLQHDRRDARPDHRA